MAVHHEPKIVRVKPFPRAAFLPALLIAAALPVAAPARADAPTPTYLKVATSRGKFDLVVYAPRSRPAAAPGEAAKPPAAQPPAAKPVVLLISGEGGWKSFDILLSGYLTDDGYWVGGVDAKAYLSDPQDDRGLLAGDMRSYAEVLSKAAGQPADAPLVLVGYSFGADLAPWIAGAAGWGGRVRGQVLIGPDENGSLQYRITEMLGFTYTDHSFLVADALKSSAGIPTFFLHGEKDGWSKAPKLHAAAAEPKKLITVPGATHHFGGHEDELRAALRDGMRWILETCSGVAPSPPRGR